jgi:hypothetical protein
MKRDKIQPIFMRMYDPQGVTLAPAAALQVGNPACNIKNRIIRYHAELALHKKTCHHKQFTLSIG